MKITKLTDYVNGWIIGDFEPNVIRTKDYEVAIKKYRKGDVEQAHYHKLATEVTVIASGVFKMNNKTLNMDDVVDLKKNEIVDFECVEDGTTIVVKAPSVTSDKYII